MAERMGPDSRPVEDPLGPGAPPGGGRRNGPRPLVVTPSRGHAPDHALLCPREPGASRGVPGQVTPRQRKAPEPTAAGLFRGLCRPLRPPPRLPRV